MNEKLKDLYHIPEQVLPQEINLLDLAEHCTYLEDRVREMAENLSLEDRQILESYLDMRDELEFQSVKAALRFSKYVK